MEHDSVANFFVFLFSNSLQCLYPLGVSDKYAKLIVRRQAAEIATLKRKRKKKQKQGEVEVIILRAEYLLCIRSHLTLLCMKY